MEVLDPGCHVTRVAALRLGSSGGHVGNLVAIAAWATRAAGIEGAS